MTIATSLFLVAVGAVLRFAVKDSIQDVDLSTVGLILMAVGVVGFFVGLWQAQRFDRTVEPVAGDRVARDRYGNPV
jgi:uncharacterized membrane protein YfcA